MEEGFDSIPKVENKMLKWVLRGMENWKTTWKVEFDDSISQKKMIENFLRFLMDRNCNRRVAVLSSVCEEYFQESSICFYSNMCSRSPL